MKGDTNGEEQNFSEGGFVKVLVGGEDPPSPPPHHPPTRGNLVPFRKESLNIRQTRSTYT